MGNLILCPITFINSVTGVTSAALPAHVAGDMIVGFSFRDGNNTAPTVPSGQNWSTIDTSAGANSDGSGLAFKIARDNAEATGTWTSATSTIFLVYRGAVGVGVNAVSDFTATSNISYPTLGLTKTDGSSTVLAFGGHRQVDNTNFKTPPGSMVLRANDVDGTDEVVAFDISKVSSFSTQSVTLNGTNGGCRTRTLELLAGYYPSPTHLRRAVARSNFY